MAKEAAGEVFERTTGILAPTVKNAGKYLAKQFVKNKIKGKTGEKIISKALANSKSGEQVSFKNSDGKVARIDFTKKDGTLVEVKTGNAKLSKNQAKLMEDIESGKSITPVGKNVKKAGFELGVPTKVKGLYVEKVKLQEN